MGFIRIVIVSIASALFVVSCNDSNEFHSVEIPNVTTSNTKENNMKSYSSMFEIPVTDMDRAIQFYEALMDITIEKMDVEEMQLGIWPYEDQLIPVVLIKEKGNQPSGKGVSVYLNAGDNLQIMLDKVEKYGGNIMVPKTAHADSSGFFALFLDSEGNKLALNSPN